VCTANNAYIQVLLKLGGQLTARVPHTETREDAHINMCTGTFTLRVIAERIYAQTSGSSASTCRQGYARMFATSVYWQSLPRLPHTTPAKPTGRCTNGTHLIGAPTHFSRAVRDVLSNTCHGRWICTAGPTAWSPQSPDLNALDFHLWEHLTSLVYAAPVDTEETLHHRTVDACQTIRICPGMSGGMRRSVM
jgi:hypothetical protein